MKGEEGRLCLAEGNLHRSGHESKLTDGMKTQQKGGNYSQKGLRC